jgi:hypothetical protein
MSVFQYKLRRTLFTWPDHGTGVSCPIGVVKASD